jgi:hypothetical protein
VRAVVDPRTTVPNWLYDEILEAVTLELVAVDHGKNSVLVGEAIAILFHLAETFGKNGGERIVLLVLEIFPSFAHLRFQGGCVWISMSSLFLSLGWQSFC